MQLHDLKPAKGSRKARKRVGRGNASGSGATSGRGTKGQLSRSGGGKGAGFEGGQTPLYQRLPKLGGFTNVNRKEYQPINVAKLEECFEADTVVDKDALVEKGLIKSTHVRVKLLGNGEITKKLTVKVDKASASAKEKVEASGGTVETQC